DGVAEQDRGQIEQERKDEPGDELHRLVGPAFRVEQSLVDHGAGGELVDGGAGGGRVLLERVGGHGGADHAGDRGVDRIRPDERPLPGSADEGGVGVTGVHCLLGGGLVRVLVHGEFEVARGERAGRLVVTGGGLLRDRRGLRGDHGQVLGLALATEEERHREGDDHDAERGQRGDDEIAVPEFDHDLAAGDDAPRGLRLGSVLGAGRGGHTVTSRSMSDRVGTTSASSRTLTRAIASRRTTSVPAESEMSSSAVGTSTSTTWTPGISRIHPASPPTTRRCSTRPRRRRSSTVPSATTRPLESTTSESHRRSTRSSWWEENNTGTPRVVCSRSRSTIESTATGSRPENGSSRIRRSGPPITAAAICTRC